MLPQNLRCVSPPRNLDEALATASLTRTFSSAISCWTARPAGLGELAGQKLVQTFARVVACGKKGFWEVVHHLAVAGEEYREWKVWLCVSSGICGSNLPNRVRRHGFHARAVHHQINPPVITSPMESTACPS